MFEQFDISILRFINVDRIHALDGFFLFFTNTAPYISGIIPLGFIVWGFFQRERSYKITGVMIGASYLLSVLISNGIKLFVTRPRPFTTYSFIEKLSTGGSSSFPSGHTSDAFSVAMAVCLLFPRKQVVIPIMIWAVLVGYSRMDLGVHYPSDVLGGAVIGMISAVLIARLFRSRGWEAGPQILESPDERA